MSDQDLDQAAAAGFFSMDRFAMNAGVRLVDARRGYGKAEMLVEERHLNAAGVVQGGAVFTLADFAFAVASNSHGQLALAVNVNISFIRSALEGTLLTAEAVELTDPGRLGHYDVNVTDPEGVLIARFTGIAYRKREPNGL